MSLLPPGLWHTVLINFGGPFPTGKYLLVVIDVYSRFPEVAIVHSTSAKTAINKLKRILNLQDMEYRENCELTMAHLFTNHEFETFLEEQGI